MIQKLLHYYDILLKAILATIVAAFTTIVFVQVVARYIFNNSLSWSEELARILFTQMIFLASPLVILEKKHIVVDILMHYMSNRTKRYLSVGITILSLIFFVFLGISGINVALSNMNQRTSALSIPMSYLYFIIPISAVMMSVNVIRAGIDDFYHTYAPNKEESL